MNKKNSTVDLNTIEASLQVAYRSGADPLAMFSSDSHADTCAVFEKACEAKLPHLALATLAHIHQCERSGNVDTPFIRTGLPFKQVMDLFVDKGLCDQAELAFAKMIGQYVLQRDELNTSYWLLNALYDAGYAMAESAIALDPVEYERLKSFLEATLSVVAKHEKHTGTLYQLIGRGYAESGSRRLGEQERENFFASMATWKHHGIVNAYFSNILDEIERGVIYKWSELMRMECGSQQYPVIVREVLDAALAKAGYNPKAFIFDILQKAMEANRFSYGKPEQVNRIQIDLTDKSVDKTKLAAHMTNEANFNLVKRTLNLDIEFLFKREDLTGPVKRLLLSTDFGL